MDFSILNDKKQFKRECIIQLITCIHRNAAKLLNHFQSLGIDVATKNFAETSFMEKCTTIYSQKTTPLEFLRGNQICKVLEGLISQI